MFLAGRPPARAPAAPSAPPHASPYAHSAPPHAAPYGPPTHAAPYAHSAPLHAKYVAPRTANAGADITAGGDYGAARVNAFKQTPAYHNAIAAVFRAQAPDRQALILQNLVRQQRSSPYAKNDQTAIAIGNAYNDLSYGVKAQIAKYAKLPMGPDIAKGAEKLLTDAGKGASGLIDQIPTTNFNTPGEHIATQQAGLAPGQLAKNALKDAVNLPAEAGPSVAIPLQQALGGHPGQALNTVVQGFTQAITNPQEHPLNAALAITGLGHGATRIVDTGARTLVGKPADLNRQSIQVTGNLTKERPALSKYPLIRNSQKSYDRVTFKRNEHGQLTPANEAQRRKYISQGVSTQVGINERIRRANVDIQRQAHEKSVLPSRPAQIAHGVKTAAKYDPQPALIPGAGVLARIADGTIRRQDTYHADLAKHITQVSANRPNLLDEPALLKIHDANVALLRKGEAVKAKNLPAVFAAADRYAQDTHVTQAQLHGLGHYNGMTSDALLRRELYPVVQTHMPGAHIDQALGIVKPASKAEVQAYVSSLRSQARLFEHRGATAKAAAVRDQIRAAWDKQVIPIKTSEMVAFANRETGKRTLAYTSHQPAKGDAAWYVSGQRRPLPVSKRNTGFAYTHGLTDPTHEALLQHRVYSQGLVDAHMSQNRLLNLLAVKQPNGQAWSSFHDAAKDAGRYGKEYKPIAFAQTFHPKEALTHALDKTTMSTMDEEALKHSLDFNQRLQPSDNPGKYGLIHEQALAQLRKHDNQISPNELLRAARGITTQFRKVALGTSVRHVPGVAQENLIRDVTNGIFIHHGVAAQKAFRRAAEIDPIAAHDAKIALTGGQAAGMTRALATHQVSRHFAGTSLERPLSTFEHVMRAPGPRQMRNAWNAYLHFTLDGTKHYLEQSHQLAGVGKALVRDFGKFGRLQGEALDRAAKNLLDPQFQRKLRAENDRFFGRWTDQTPAVQSALMFSPFGMWWANSARFLGRLPIDHPVKTGVLAAANTGTAQQRQQLGLDMFSPGHLPPYQQGAIPLPGGGLWQANYYSPAGVANDPFATGQSLILPWLEPILLGAAGDNWLGKPITSPSNPRPGSFGGREPSALERGTVILNSMLSSIVPLYTKAQQIAEGGASQYDTSGLATGLHPKPGQTPSLKGGLEKAFTPLKISKRRGATTGGGGGNLMPIGAGGNTYNLPNGGGQTMNPGGGTNTYNLPSQGGGGGGGGLFSGR